MPTFIITTAAHTPKGRPRKVKFVADYVRVEEGRLILRKQVKDSYPFMVAMFAAGAWLNVEQETPDA